MPVLYRYDLVEVDLDPTLQLEFGPADDLMAEIGEYLLIETDERFESETDPDGQPWEPLSPASLLSGFRKRSRRPAFRKRRSPEGERMPTAAFTRYAANKKILQELGTRGGLRGTVAYEESARSVRIGSNKVYAAAQQFGLGERSSLATQRSFGTLPARRFIGVSSEGRSVIADMIRRWTAERASE